MPLCDQTESSPPTGAVSIREFLGFKDAFIALLMPLIIIGES